MFFSNFAEKLSDADPLEVFGRNLTGSCGAAPWKDSPSSSPDDCQGPSRPSLASG
jgi:hypothetical protein